MTWLKSIDDAAITIADTVRVLGVDERTVSRAIDAGEIPAVRIGRRVLVPRLRLLAMFDAPSPTPIGAQPGEGLTTEADSGDAALGRAVRCLLERLAAGLGHNETTEVSTVRRLSRELADAS